MRDFIFPIAKRRAERNTHLSKLTTELNISAILVTCIASEEQRETKREIRRAISQEMETGQDFFLFCSAVQIAFLNSITMPALLMTPVITAAMSKLIKVVGSLSRFHAEAHLAQRRFPVIAAAGTSSGPSAFNPLTRIRAIPHSLVTRM